VGLATEIDLVPPQTDDWHSVDVTTTPQLIQFRTLTPGDGPGAFDNNLNPRIELYDPSGNLVESGTPGLDGRNEKLSYNAHEPGTYRVRVVGEDGTRGEYVLARNTAPLGGTAVASVGSSKLSRAAVEPGGEAAFVPSQALVPSFGGLDATALRLDGSATREGFAALAGSSTSDRAAPPDAKLVAPMKEPTTPASLVHAGSAATLNEPVELSATSAFVVVARDCRPGGRVTSSMSLTWWRIVSPRGFFCSAVNRIGRPREGITCRASGGTRPR
jgi:hypothetical protein